MGSGGPVPNKSLTSLVRIKDGKFHGAPRVLGAACPTDGCCAV